MSGFVSVFWSDEERGLTDNKQNLQLSHYQRVPSYTSFWFSDVKCDCCVYQEGKSCLYSLTPEEHIQYEKVLLHCVYYCVLKNSYRTTIQFL